MPLCSGHILPYIPPLVLIRVQSLELFVFLRLIGLPYVIWVSYFVIIHYGQPNPSLGDTVKCVYSVTVLHSVFSHNIKSKYVCQWAILKFFGTFVKPVQRNHFHNESTSHWTPFPNVHNIGTTLIPIWTYTHIHACTYSLGGGNLT